MDRDEALVMLSVYIGAMKGNNNKINSPMWSDLLTPPLERDIRIYAKKSIVLLEQIIKESEGVGDAIK